MPKNKALLAMGFWGLLVLSCAFSYDDGAISQELADRVPDTMLTDFVFRQFENGKIVFELRGDQASIYNKTKINKLVGAHFAQYDGDGKEITHGQADKATYFSDTENAEFEGNIKLFSEREKMDVEAEYLSWDKAKKLLSSKPKSPVILDKKDSMKLEGENFWADFKKNSIGLETVRGTLIDEKEKP